MKIVAINKESPLNGEITVGSDLVKVNGQLVADIIDYHFHNTEETLNIEVIDGGKIRKIQLDEFACGDLGLTFEEAKIRICHNNCIFCFVHQQPKGMRRSLYLKDDDYRYSFTHGNFITLSEMDENDFERIIRQRLSPLYISVHSTDNELRRYIFQNDKLKPILPQLKRLTENGIMLQTQTVVCPGLNDGRHLEKTITDLAALAPGVDSLGVVPVGLTRYRKRLPELRLLTGEEAGRIIDLVESYQNEFMNRLGTRFVYPADELFLQAGRRLPPLGYYEEMPQFENGIGMMRQFIVDFNRRKRGLPTKVNRKLRMEIVTGKSAESILLGEIVPVLDRIKNLKVMLNGVDNTFWGETVTVTGLLTGKDILNALHKSNSDIIILPPNCLNSDALFLDDLSLDQFRSEVRRPVLTGTYNMAALVRGAISLWEN
jgi:putative radical SAM enzyme (TIGR03279 family)